MLSKPTYEDLEKRIRELELADSERLQTEGSFPLSLKQLEEAQQIAEIGHWEANMETGGLFWSAVVFDIFGYDPKSFKPCLEAFYSAVHPDDRNRVRTSERLSEQSGVHDVIHRIIRPDGKTRFVHERARRHVDSRGKPVLLRGTVQDVTELKCSEEALREERQRLANIILGIDAGTWEWNIQTGETLFNDRWAEIIGYTLEEMAPINIGTWLKYCHPDDVVRSNVLLQKHFNQEESTYECEARMQHKDGHWVWVLDRGRVVSRTPDGKPLWMYGTHIDVTNHKRAEEDLNLMAGILDEAPAYISIHDGEGRLLFANKTAYKLHGYTREEFMSRRIQDLCVPESTALIKERLHRVRETGEGRFEVSHFRKNGSTFPLEVHSKVIDWHDQKAFLAICTDLTERKAAEARQQEMQRRTQDILSEIADTFYSLDEQWRFSIVNPAAEKAPFGRPASELLGRVIWELYPGLVGTPIHQHYLNAAKHHTLEHYDAESPLNGRWYEVLMKGWQGGVDVYMQDINERKKNEEDLTRFKKMEQERKESEERYRTLVNTIPYGIQLSDLEGKILFSNPAHHRIQGHPEGALIGKYVWDIITDDIHRKQARERYTWIIREQPIPAAYYSQNKTQTGNLINIRMDWDYVRNPKGEIEGVISVISDITDVKKAEAERERLLSAIEQSHETILITDTTGAIQYANPSFAKTTGYACQEVLGKNPRFLKSGLHDQSLYQNLWKTISAGEIWTGRIINKRKDGTLYTEDAAITPVKDPQGEIVNYVAVKRDITKDIEMEKRISQSQRLEAIGTLAGGIAHDFNNLLFPILGLSEILMEDLPQNSPEYENVEEIYKAAKRGGDLVKQILSFSRQSAQQRIPVRLQHILKEALKLCRSAIPSNIEIKSDIRNDCGIVSADPTQIHQIVMNLITNAYHALEDTSGSIFVQLTEVFLTNDDVTHMAFSPGQYAALTISDTGCGIDPKVVDKIFEPYFTTKPQGKGTGLGLSTVYGIVKEHGGDIRMTSELGKGTAFTIWFPLLEKSAPEKEDEESAPFQPGAGSILLIDDEEPIIRFEKQLLERMGYTVTTRTSSVEALSEFRENPNRFDLVITDMTMPKLTGDRLAEELLAIRPDLPIILCTGFSEKLTEKKIRAMGIRGLLMKPVLKSKLYHMVKNVLNEPKKNKVS